MTASDAAFVERPTVEVDGVSVSFGAKVAVVDLSCSFGPGITGLLGPNGAGKTTLMRAICGLLDVGAGAVRVLGTDPRADRRVYASLALVPEHDPVPGGLTAHQLVEYAAALHGAGPAAVAAALATVDLTDVAARRVGTFSKGMRQRAKVAAALVGDPEILVLDEPLNGADPVQRHALIDLFRRLGSEGRTVIVSSHVLHEVELLADRVVVLVGGRLAAAGSHRAIRAAMDDRPRTVLCRADDVRALAAALVRRADILGVEVAGDAVRVACASAGGLAADLARTAVDAGVVLREVRPLDETLESVFREVVR